MNEPNKRPVDYRPFNVEHAKAGAPYGLSTGDAVRILCYDRAHIDHPYPIVSLIKNAGVETTCLFNIQGFCSGLNKTYLFMIPLGYVDDKPVFVGDSLFVFSTSMKRFVPVTVGPKTNLKKRTFRWTLKKKVKKEVWQARIRTQGYEVIHMSCYPSEQSCVNAEKRIYGPAFVRAELISTYEVEE